MHLNKKIVLFVAYGIAIIASGCCGTPRRTISPRSGNSADIYSSTDRGFTKEMDEPSARGMLSRVTPEEYDVQLSFCMSPVTKDIIFSASPSGERGRWNAICNLWKIPANGGVAVKLTSGGEEHCLYPSYTPDGKHIVYSSNGQLWKIKENGAGGRIKIGGSGLGNDFAPKVSSKGKIVFCSSSSFSSSSYYGSSNTRYYTPYYSSQKIILWICDADGGNLTQLREGESPVWTPDGNTIAFSYEGDIWMMNADGTTLTQLTSSPDYTEGCPSVSSDGQYILYASNESSKKSGIVNDFNIWRMKLDGTEKMQLTELESWDAFPIMDDGVLYFSSGRATKDRSSRAQRIWKIKTNDEAAPAKQEKTE